MAFLLTPLHIGAVQQDHAKFLRRVFDAAIASAKPEGVLAKHLPAPANGRNIVIGAGKAAAAMAAALEAAWPDVALEGVVVTRYGHAVPTGKIKILQAAHPVPDAASEAAAHAMLDAVTGLSPQDQVIALISGGASSLLVLPAAGLSLEDKQWAAKALLASGAPIAVMNRIRTRLSAIKGGKLAQACRPAALVTLAISDVPGDDPMLIGSGPTVVAGADYRLIATPATALEAAANVARAAGIPVKILGDAVQGEASELGRGMAANALRQTGPMLLLSGGETTVTIGAAKPGRGGRNTEFLLSLAIALGGAAKIFALAGDSDGIDGTENAAGAIVTPDTLGRARAAGLDPAAMLKAHDSYSLFAKLGDLVITGPTLTNVNDIRAILIL
jgi:hydroxypyruvate reductase